MTHHIETVVEAKQYLHDYWEDGCVCPACGQHVQLYNYKLFATSAYALILLYRLTKKDPDQVYFHISKYAEAGAGRVRAPHFAELRFWELVEKKPLDEKPQLNDEAKKSSGYWRITIKGQQFVENRLQVYSRILVYNNQFQGFAKNAQFIGIREALTIKFDYRDIMGEDYGKVLREAKAVSWINDE